MSLTLSGRRPLSSRNQSIDLLCKSIDWFLYYRDLHHERLKDNFIRHPKKLELANALQGRIQDFKKVSQNF